MPLNRWWESDPAERYWLEITDREDLGNNLHIPQVDGSGNDYWSYSLVTEVQEGDVVFHWWKRGSGEPAVVGWSRAAGLTQTSTIVWQAHGTFGRSRDAGVAQPAWLLPLTGFTELSPVASLAAVRKSEQALRSIRDDLIARHSSPIYFPFVFSNKRPLRTAQGYLVKLPAAVVEEIQELHINDETPTTTPSVPSPANKNAYLQDALLRLAVERHAVGVVVEYLTSLGYHSKDVGAIEPYDILAQKDGKEIHVEVKGSLTPRLTVNLTDGEVKHARADGNTLLAVVDGITRAKGTELQLLGGRLRVWELWQPDDDALVATEYRYLLPGGHTEP